MAWSTEHKERTRQTILDSAALLFTRSGFDHVSIDDVMKHAGLTRGAFYAHFKSKAHLYAEAILAAAQRTGKQTHPDNPTAPSLEELIKTYLSMEHRAGNSFRCPLAFLATDITQRDAQVREAYTLVFKGFVKHINHHLRHNGIADSSSFAKSHQLAVSMIGSLTIARALNDESLARALLENSATQLLATLQQPH